jgi:hypothetical protein
MHSTKVKILAVMIGIAPITTLNFFVMAVRIFAPSYRCVNSEINYIVTFRPYLTESTIGIH